MDYKVRNCVFEMGNTPTKSEKRVTFHPSVKIDRYEESTRRYDHLMDVYKHYQLGHHDVKEKLAHLVIAYLKRCHENVNMIAEEQHALRVKSVCIIALETFTGYTTEIQSHALVQACVCMTLVQK